MDNEITKILEQFPNTPVQITVIYTTTSALNSYGNELSKEITVKTVQRFCKHCKLVDANVKSPVYCSVETEHALIWDWTLIDSSTYKKTT